MVEIIKGTYGYFNGRKVKPLSFKDGSQRLDPNLEARLVKDKIARYVEEPKSAPENERLDEDDELEDPDEPEELDEDDGSELPAYNRNMKLNDLKEIAKLYGVDASKCTAKAEVCDLIDKKLAESDDEDGEEDQPDLTPADPV